MATRVVIGEDDVLFREGVAPLLLDAGVDVVAQAGHAEDLLRKGLAHRPDVVIADINMPPGRAEDGLNAAIEIRAQRPDTGVLILSQYYDEDYAMRLIGDGDDGVGYLLKERVGDIETFLDAVGSVAAGQCAVEPGDRLSHAGAPPDREPGSPGGYSAARAVDSEAAAEASARSASAHLVHKPLRTTGRPHGSQRVIGSHGPGSVPTDGVTRRRQRRVIFARHALAVLTLPGLRQRPDAVEQVGTERWASQYPAAGAGCRSPRSLGRASARSGSCADAR